MVSYCLASIEVTDSRPGQNTPIMREMIPSLAEVYCITDPSLPDNPIVYASQGVYILPSTGHPATVLSGYFQNSTMSPNTVGSM